MRQIVLAGEHPSHTALLSCFSESYVPLTERPTGLSEDDPAPWAVCLAPCQSGMQGTLQIAIRRRIPLMLCLDAPLPPLKDLERLQTATVKRRIPTAALSSLRTLPAIARLREWISAGVLGKAPVWEIFIPREQLQATPLHVWVDAIWWMSGSRVPIELSHLGDGVVIGSPSNTTQCFSHPLTCPGICAKGNETEAQLVFTEIITPNHTISGQTCRLQGNNRNLSWALPAAPPLLALEAAALWGSDPTHSMWGISMTLTDALDAIRAVSMTGHQA